MSVQYINEESLEAQIPVVWSSLHRMTITPTFVVTLTYTLEGSVQCTKDLGNTEEDLKSQHLDLKYAKASIMDWRA